MFSKRPGLVVYGGDNRIPAVTKIVKDGEEFKIGQIDVKALFTICHTSASVSFYLQDENDKAVFTGKVFQVFLFQFISCDFFFKEYLKFE